MTGLTDRVDALDWPALGAELRLRRVAGEVPRGRADQADHGVSAIRSGRRHTLGLVLHDAQ
jgi:hypothetical protein